jgi:8-oxo-dGTP pyrophosphatase MutT (NUDIX family)
VHSDDDRAHRFERMNQGQAARLREVLLDPLEAARIEVAGVATAAVLVPLYERDGELFAVFIRRRENLRWHAGQISFPGGGRDPGDAELTDTALREAEEEIGLERSAVRVLGALRPTAVPASGFALYPFVGAITVPPRWQIAEREVQAVLEFPLASLARSYVKREMTRADHTFETDTYTAGDVLIWGATARVLSDLLARMGLLEGA